jgi:transcriptional regulator with XRE-family HTH domain
MITFAEKLNILRKHRGMTQEQLAKAAGVSAVTVVSWEKNVVPRAGKLQTLADLFGVTTELLPDYEISELAAEDNYRLADAYSRKDALGS